MPGAFATSAVYSERDMDLSPPTDDEIIIATVRVRNVFRRLSVEEGAALPERSVNSLLTVPRPAILIFISPSKRPFLSRLSSRVLYTSSPGSNDRYTAIKMPRRDYKRYFACDRLGNYIGTEPKREWDDADLQRQFGLYQNMPLRSVPGQADSAEDRGEPERSGSGSTADGNDGSVDGEHGASRKDVEGKEGDGSRGGKSEEEWWL